jgi:FkbM family methyltransferase
MNTRRIMYPYNEFHGERLDGKTVDEVLRSYFSKNTGIFFDVGAFEPVRISNSYHFEKNGWDCYCFEANTDLIPELQSKRKHVYNYAIANEDKESVTFHIVQTSNWTAGFSAITINEDYKKIFPCEFQSVKLITVPQRTLNSIIEHEIPEVTEIDILSIDIEGGEYNCLQGLDLVKYKPKVLVIENVTNDVSIRTYLEQNKYRLDQQIAYNQYYTHETYKKE